MLVTQPARHTTIQPVGIVLTGMSVETRDGIRGGEPVISGTRIPILDIADVYLAEDEDAHATITELWRRVDRRLRA